MHQTSKQGTQSPSYDRWTACEAEQCLWWISYFCCRVPSMPGLLVALFATWLMCNNQFTCLSRFMARYHTVSTHYTWGSRNSWTILWWPNQVLTRPLLLDCMYRWQPVYQEKFVQEYWEIFGEGGNRRPLEGTFQWGPNDSQLRKLHFTHIHYRMCPTSLQGMFIRLPRVTNCSLRGYPLWTCWHRSQCLSLP